MEPATRIERATCHRFGPEACLTDSYEGGQPPCTIPTKGTHPLRIPTARWFYHWLGSRLLSQPGAGDWNRTSDLRFTKFRESNLRQPNPTRSHTTGCC